MSAVHLRPGFTRWHLPPAPEGFDATPAINRITSRDFEFHDHPMPIFSLILDGGYFEEVLSLDGRVEFIERHPGDAFTIAPGHIHRIVGVPQMGATTINYFGPHERRTSFYRLHEGRVEARWHDSDVWEARS